jgi:hypothetical protein
LYIARSLRELGRWTEARDHFRATIREAEERGAKYAGAREAAETELRDVEVRLERSDSKAPEKAEKAAETAAPASPALAPPTPATGASPAPVSAEAPISTTTMRLPSALTWATGGVAVAGLASFGVLYGLASNRYSYLEDHCGGTGARDAGCDDALSTGRTQEGVAYVALGVGVVAAAVAVVSYAMSSRVDDRPRARRPVWLVTF